MAKLGAPDSANAKKQRSINAIQGITGSNNSILIKHTTKE